PERVSADGSHMSGDLVSRLAGPMAPGRVAQAGMALAEPIGAVESLSGTVIAVRAGGTRVGLQVGDPVYEGDVVGPSAGGADGTRVELQVGEPVYQGDVLETSADGAVGIVLADDSSFSMAGNGRMVLDEMIYDPASQEGSLSLSVVEGIFTFVSGQIAKTD